MLNGIVQRLGRHAHSSGAAAFRAYGPIVALMVLYYGAASLVLGEHDAEIPMALVDAVFNLKFMLFALAVTGAILGYALLARKTDEPRLVRLKRLLARQPYPEIVLLRFLPVVFLMIPFQKTYTAVKAAIPDIVPFTWDAGFAWLDRLIFMGADPWTLTHWLLPWPLATWAMNVAYLLWFYALMGCLAVAALMPLESRLRLTYLLACFLSWAVGGSLLAVIFSSAGPVYYERLFGDPVFAPLFERLSAQNETYALISLTAQETLWQAHVDPAIPPVGISAFPSMHLCIAAGMVLFAFRISRLAGWLLAAFTAVMMVGSVHLGWHYAVDGFAGIALAILFWRVSERFAGWWLGTPAVPLPAGASPAGT